jgi:phosphotransferase system  glucose/maltose/N-acetylglucosamine-specific IIC component
MTFGSKTVLIGFIRRYNVRLFGLGILVLLGIALRMLFSDKPEEHVQHLHVISGCMIAWSILFITFQRVYFIKENDWFMFKLGMTLPGLILSIVTLSVVNEDILKQEKFLTGFKGGYVFVLIVVALCTLFNVLSGPMVKSSVSTHTPITRT